MNKQSETTYPAVLGRILAKYRKELGYNQSEMAKKAGLNQSTWSRIENGDLVPDIAQLQQISDALGIALPDLISEVDTTCNAMKKAGYIVHPNKIKLGNNKALGGLGLALIGAAALGAFIASQSKDTDKNSE